MERRAERGGTEGVRGVYACNLPLLEGREVFSEFAEGEHGLAHATFDRSGMHRFTLGRQWGEGRKFAVFCMLNPSTADAFRLDPTVTRCFNFSKGWGMDGMIVVNLFSLRTPKPSVLFRSGTPNHHLNDLAITEAAGVAGLLVAGWGNGGRRWGRDEAVLSLLGKAGAIVHSLGPLNSRGTPKHPLYLPGNSRLSVFARAGAF